MPTEITIALISAIIPVLGNILLELIRRKNGTPPEPNNGILLPPGAKYYRSPNWKRNWVITALIALICAAIGYFGSRAIYPPVGNLPIPTTASTQNFTPPTLIPRINKILEINFSYGDRGICNTDDPKIGGTDNSQDNYFVFGQKNGYITYCNISPLVNQGNLEITADPHGSPDYFGYGVLMGFIGGDQRNLCSFEIIKDFSKTKAVFGEYINGKFTPTAIEIEGYSLDTNPHTIRMVLYPDGKAIGFVDEQKITEHIFAGCSEGRIGFVAYGQGDDRISFDDLKLYAIP